jgi:YbbR domain-containing protein
MKQFIKETLLENWSLKATAVLLSLILWLFVRGEPGPERVVSVPLEIQVPRHMEITNERPASVAITMRGAAFSNMWFGQSLPACIVDLQGASEGLHVISLTPENIQSPKGSGVEVLQVNPARISILLERTISKEVAIVVPIRGDPPSGFEIYGKTLKPASTIITGPRSHIEPIQDIPTEAVSINGQKQSTRFFVNLNLKDNTVRTSISSPVQVDVQIGPRRKLNTIESVPLATDNPALSTIPRQVTVQVLAPVTGQPELVPENLNAMVVTKGLDPSNCRSKQVPR